MWLFGLVPLKGRQKWGMFLFFPEYGFKPISYPVIFCPKLRVHCSIYYWVAQRCDTGNRP